MKYDVVREIVAGNFTSCTVVIYIIKKDLLDYQ